MAISIEKLIEERFLAKNFCTSFERACDSFDIQIDGFGSIKLPIQPKTAKKLIELALPSKFGFKEETLYDPNIRSSFEIASNKIILSADFKKQINSSLEQIKKDLLFPENSKLRAELHNMLIYEKGSFCNFHQDSEKEDGMVASLVVVLPSNYRGGELLIEHQGQSKELGGYKHYQSDPVSNNLKFMAFYADCLHKVNKITSGYRLSLTFNLIMDNPEEIKNNNDYSKESRALEQYFSTKENLPAYIKNKPKWFVYLLNHQYTSRSLHWKTLKGIDKEIAALLKQSADDLQLDIHLALADVQETWDVAADDYDYRSKYRRRWTNDETNVDNLDVTDLINSETSLSNWLNQDGEPVDLASHYVSDSMIFMAKNNSLYKPENAEYEGYMGNYGNTLDRWYKRTAIVLWPKNTSLESKFAIDANMGIKEFIKSIKSNDNTLSNDKLINEIILQSNTINRVDMENLVDFSIKLNNREYCKKIISNCSIEKILSVDHKKFIDLLSHFGDNIISHILETYPKIERHWVKENKSISYHKVIISIYNDYPLTTEALLNFWLKELEHDFILNNQEAGDVERRDKYIKDTQSTLIFLIKTLQITNKINSLNKIFSILQKNEPQLGSIFLYEILHHKDLEQHFEFLSKYQTLKKKALEEVSQILDSPLSNDDWEIVELPKCSCELCFTLAEFLSCKSSKEKIWSLNKEKRQHIHRIIDQLKIPVSHETLRQGSPQRLVLRKEQVFFSWRKNRQDRLRKLLA